MDGDGLDVHAVEAAFDEVKLSGIVGQVASEHTFGRCAKVRVGNRRKLDGLPSLVAWIELAENPDQFQQQAHRESAGAASDVNRLEVVDGRDENFDFEGGELVGFGLPGKEVPQALLQGG